MQVPLGERTRESGLFMLTADFARLAGRGVTDVLLTMRSYYNMQK